MPDLRYDIPPRRPHGRDQSADQRRQQDEPAGKRPDPAVEGHRVLQRRHRGRERHEVQCDRERQPDRRPGADEQKAFGEHRPDDPSPCGAQGHTNRQLTPSLRRPGHQQPHDIDARDEQHQARRDPRNRREELELRRSSAKLKCRHGKHRRRPALRRQAVRIRTFQVCAERGDRLLRLRRGGAWRQPPEDGEARTFSAVEHRQRQPAERNVYIGAHPAGDRTIVVAQHTDNVEGLAVDDERLPDGGGIAPEVGPPESRGDHRHARLALGPAVGDRKRPAEEGIDPEHFEEVRGHDHAGGARDVASGPEIEADRSEA